MLASTPTMASSAADTPSPMTSSQASPNFRSHDSPHPLTPHDHTHMTHNHQPSHPLPSQLPGTPQPSITGPITLDPFAKPSATLNPRSCVTCRRRKVRCDKHMPCGNCRKAQIQCVFPAPGRAPRRPRAKDPNAPPKQTSEREMELMKRLRKLEGIVEDLSGQIEFETYKHSGNSESPEATSDTIQENDRRKTPASPPIENTSSNSAPPGYSVPRRTNTSNSTTSSSVNARGDVNKDFGKLVLNEKGKIRYVSNAFWTKITDEVRMVVIMTFLLFVLIGAIDRGSPVRDSEAHR
jgi:hypothetical protein